MKMLRLAVKAPDFCVYFKRSKRSLFGFFFVFQIRKLSLLASVRAVVAVRTWLYFKWRRSALDRVFFRAIKYGVQYVCVGRTVVFGIQLLYLLCNFTPFKCFSAGFEPVCCF